MKKRYIIRCAAFSVLREKDSNLKRREREARNSGGLPSSERLEPTERGGEERQIYGVNLRKSFSRQCRAILPQDSITEDELENLNYLYDAYTSLGLNGTGEELYRRCLEKPIQ